MTNLHLNTPKPKRGKYIILIILVIITLMITVLCVIGYTASDKDKNIENLNKKIENLQNENNEIKKENQKYKDEEERTKMVGYYKYGILNYTEYPNWNGNHINGNTKELTLYKDNTYNFIYIDMNTYTKEAGTYEIKDNKLTLTCNPEKSEKCEANRTFTVENTSLIDDLTEDKQKLEKIQKENLQILEQAYNKFTF